jgi:hypothetical protein
MYSRRAKVGLAVCFTIAFVFLLLWARSYFYADQVSCTSGNSFGSLSSVRGEIKANYTTFTNAAGFPRVKFFSWNSTSLGTGWGLLTFRSLVNVQWRNGVAPWGGGVRIHSFAFPTWVVGATAAVLPCIYLLRVRKFNSFWMGRETSYWVDPRLRERVVRFAIFSAVGCVAGASIAMIEVKFPYRDSRWSWLFIICGLAPIVCLMAVFTRRRVLWHRAILWMGLELAGCVCFFQATIERIWRYYNVNFFEIPDLLQMVLMAGAACFVVGAVLLLFLQVKPEEPKPGPYCPQCGYCLIGLPRQICSECGRPFTLAELGVTAEMLNPPQTARA